MMSSEFGMGGFRFLFGIFPYLFLGVFAVVIGAFIVTAVRGVRTWNRNNASPKLTVSAEVVSKRTDVTSRRHRPDDAIGYPVTSTRYLATFQMESGDRMELPLSGAEYGLLAEGDRGSLTFQGTRYLGFQRG